MRQFLKNLPPVKAWRRQRWHQYFLSPRGHGMNWGAYETFASAQADLPPANQGYDTDGIGEAYILERTTHVFSYDYPVMFWLERAFQAGATSVFDIGGSVGVHFLSYRRYMSFPASIRWLISEVPAIVKLGRELCEKRGIQGLSFTEDFDHAGVQADVWISAGALHHLEPARSLGKLLQGNPNPPTHILLNKLPIYDGPTFVSTQNLSRGAFAPHYVWNAESFIAEVLEAGYELKDRWDVPERRFRIFDAPERAFSKYEGLYFVRKDAAAA